MDKTYEVARHLLDEQVERIEDAGGRVAETYVRRGPAIDEILDLAEEIGAGFILLGSRGLGLVKGLLLGSVSERTLLAVGSRGRGPLKRLRLGSVSTKVLKVARGPVLIYPHPRRNE